MQAVLTREERGKMIAEKPNQIIRQSKRRYRVVSQSGHGTYDVTRTRAIAVGWICTCPDFTYRSVKCKHIWGVEFSVKLREVVRPRVIEPIDVHVCLYCKSDRLIKWGIRHNRYGDIQKFSCKSCGRYFTVNLGFERMKHSPQGTICRGPSNSAEPLPSSGAFPDPSSPMDHETIVQILEPQVIKTPCFVRASY
jgi:hypothetical protein